MRTLRPWARGWAANYAVGVEDRFPDFAAWVAARHAEYGLGADAAAVRETFLRLADELDRQPIPWPGALPPELAGNELRDLMLGAVAGATICNDVAWPRSIERHRRDVRANRAACPLTAGRPVNIGPCSFWHQPAEPPTRVTSKGPSNILLIQNLRDPATPYSGALKLLRAFGHRANMVTVDSGGHGVYLANGNACGDRAVTALLAGGIAENLTCPAQ
ncbi:alpha/beta hydrolase [Nonomuraea sp. NPDC049419]|uniref:alpha/beta hydrolase n=1 Tax=Nonomuraea sp. NPDC049419 TaxID=3155772 RepID=UPI00342DE974